jgi:PII-like signaling protein
MVHTSERSRHDGRPVHVELVRRLRAAGAAGATTVRGIWGFHGDHPPHGDRLLQVARRVGVLTTVVDEPGRIAGLFGIVDELTRERGLVTSEAVPFAEAGPAPGQALGAR